MRLLQNSLSRAKTMILDILFPPYCFGCGNEGCFLCFYCRGSVYFVPPTCFVCYKLAPPRNKITYGRTCPSCQDQSSIYAFLSPFSYNSIVIREIIHGLKYGRIRSLGIIIADLLAEYFKKYDIKFPDNAILLPVPIYPLRMRRRGFNQAEHIANVLSPILGILVINNVLEKYKYTKPQVELSREDRLKNIRGSFVVRNPDKIQGKTILLFDDVKTTGATLEEAGRVLKEAGAEKIWVITLAH